MMAAWKTQLGEVFAWLQTDTGAAATAGALGGLVRWLTLREKPAEGFIALIVGSVCAVYLGPIVDPILEPLIGQIAPGEDAQGFASFVVGLGGIGLAGWLIDTTRRLKSGGGDDEKA